MGIVTIVWGNWGLVERMGAGESLPEAERAPMVPPAREQDSRAATRTGDMVVLQGGRVALIGIALGVLVALGVTRYLAALLFNVQPLDASTFVIMSSVMLAVALLASYVPARRASAVDPMESLGVE